MFVRLFVDENLDRMVPISKQPKDKIQAILEACDRQFPEFHIRSRKRIRTYLKSCRRMRRSKEQNGWEPVSVCSLQSTHFYFLYLLSYRCNALLHKFSKIEFLGRNSLFRLPRLNPEGICYKIPLDFVKI